MIHAPDWKVLNYRIFTAPLNIRTESGEHFEWNYIPEYEFLDVPFEIRPGIFVAPGGYVMHRYRAEVNTSTKRRVIADASFRHGDFSDGPRQETSLGLRYRLGRLHDEFDRWVTAYERVTSKLQYTWRF